MQQFEKSLPSPNHALVAQLYQLYAPTLLMYISRHVPSREDAEDVLLEVFQAAIESDTLLTVDERKHHAWLWTVAHRKAIDHYRGTRHHPISTLPIEEIENMLFDDDLTAPELLALRQEMYAELRSYVLSLPPLQQEVLRLRFGHGLKCPEIAQQLNKSNDAIRAVLTRALNLLRTSYAHSKEEV